MRKPIMNKYRLLCAGLAFTLCGAVLAQTPSTQPVLGQLIEQAKTNKLTEMTQARAASSAVAGPAMPAMGALPGLAPIVKNTPKRATEPKTKPMPELPALWSLSGINSQLTAELWDRQNVHRLLAAPGVPVPGGWEIIAADPNSLTLRHGAFTRTLYPAAPGSSGGEYAMMKAATGMDDALSAGRQANKNQFLPAPIPITGSGIPNSALPFLQSGSADAKQPTSLNAAREAATGLPTIAK